MVERLHRQLKAALMSANNAAHWVDNLSLVLLGIRSTFKPDIGACAAELVYGATLRLPGELVNPTEVTRVGSGDLLHRLRQFVQALRPPPPRSVSRPTYIDSALRTCTHVYLRCDRVRSPLQPPYDGPYVVISRRDKVFKIRIGEREDNVSIDRLKPAVVDEPQASPPKSPTDPSISPKSRPPEPVPFESLTSGSDSRDSSRPLGAAVERVTRRGRHVRFPDRFVSYRTF
jgi:cleavage and polyadenylation specificity factor subunit 1